MDQRMANLYFYWCYQNGCKQMQPERYGVKVTKTTLSLFKFTPLPSLQLRVATNSRYVYRKYNTCNLLVILLHYRNRCLSEPIIEMGIKYSPRCMDRKYKSMDICIPSSGMELNRIHVIYCDSIMQMGLRSIHIDSPLCKNAITFTKCCVRWQGCVLPHGIKNIKPGGNVKNRNVLLNLTSIHGLNWFDESTTGTIQTHLPWQCALWTNM